jgi:hypothetical protein
MSGIVAGSIAAAFTTASTVVLATFPEAKDILSPLTEGGSEYTTYVAAMLISFPILAVLTVIAGAGRD